MAVDDSMGNIKEKIVEALGDVVESIQHKKAEIKAVVAGKTPEQVEPITKKNRKSEEGKNDEVTQGSVRPVIESPVATALGGVHPETVATIGNSAITQTVTDGNK